MRQRPLLFRRRFAQNGLSMIELLTVIAIISLLIISSYLLAQTQLSRARDARKKQDIEKYRIGLEEYFNDKGRYPLPSEMAACGSGALHPYIPSVLCEPGTGNPYAYYRNVVGNKYWLYTQLEAVDDPVIAARGCQSGCGPDVDGDGAGDFNFGVSHLQVVTGLDDPEAGGGSVSVPTPTPSGSTPPGSGGDTGGTGGPGIEPLIPTCDEGGGVYSCFANVCGSCCPGVNYRCSSDGLSCIPDSSCTP